MASFTLDNTGIGPAAATELAIPNNATTSVIFTNDTDSRVVGEVGLGSDITINGLASRHAIDIPAKGYIILSVVSTATSGTNNIGFNDTSRRLMSSHRTVAQSGESIYFGLV